MPYTPTTGDRLLAAWLSLTSTLWNKRLVSTLTYNEAVSYTHLTLPTNQQV